MLSTSDIEKAHAIANSQADVVLNSLGLTSDRSGYIKCSCPVHQGDNPNGFSWHPKKMVWKCWTHGCHEKLGSNLLGLIRGIKNCNLDEAVAHVYALCDGNFTDTDVERKNFIKSGKTESVGETVMDKGKLENMKRDTSYFRSRGLSPDILEKHLCFTCKTQGHPLFSRACIPILNDKDQLVGFNGRILEDNKISDFAPKWKIYPPSFPKERILFNLNYAKESIQKTNTVILVEGPLDVMRMQESGIENVVGALGTSLSLAQITLLIQNKCQNVVIAFDPDTAGIKATEKLLKKLAIYFNVSQISLKKDPSDYTISEIQMDLMPALKRLYSVD